MSPLKAEAQAIVEEREKLFQKMSSGDLINYDERIELVFAPSGRELL